MMDTRDSIERILGFSRSKKFRELEDSESKQIIEVVLKCINKMFPNLSWDGLTIRYSNNDFNELQKNLECLDLEFLRITLDIEGFQGIPDEWLDFAEFLVKIQRGKQFQCNNMLGDLARLIVFKISGFSNDKVFVRTFYKSPTAQIIKFFKKFKLTINNTITGNN